MIADQLLCTPVAHLYDGNQKKSKLAQPELSLFLHKRPQQDDQPRASTAEFANSDQPPRAAFPAVQIHKSYTNSQLIAALAVRTNGTTCVGRGAVVDTGLAQHVRATPHALRLASC